MAGGSWVSAGSGPGLPLAQLTAWVEIPAPPPLCVTTDPLPLWASVSPLGI